jgi:predicted MFS family arabinose efflux permease
VIIGIASFWMVHDFPDEARFLTPSERQRVIRRLREDGQASGRSEELRSVYVWQALKDWKTYLFMVIYGGSAGSLYAFSLFLPSIIKELGYTSTKANLLSVPPYGAAFALTITVGWLADRTKRRAAFNLAVSLLAVVGFGLLIVSENARVKYAATFFCALGIYPTIANTITWASNNIEGVYKRGIVLGMVIG